MKQIKHSKYLFLLFVVVLNFSSNQCFSQKFIWKAEMNNFFDNSEFGNHAIKNSLTLSGTHIVPQLGVQLNENHRIIAGADLLHRYGSQKLIDYSFLIAFYEYQRENFRFRAGAFPRKHTLNGYQRMFFSDSVREFRPTISGFFLEYRKAKNHANLWLDWTSIGTINSKEAFFVGWSGKINRSIFYLQHYGYMFHFLAKSGNTISVRDNVKTLTSFGIDLSQKTGFNLLETNIGWSLSFERNRLSQDIYIPHGLLSETKIEYKGVGLNNTLYLGKPQQKFYVELANDLYWGDLMYKTNFYNRTDFIVHFMKSNLVNISMEISLHFANKHIYNQQIIKADFAIDNFENQKFDKSSYRYLWSNWFK